MSVAALVFFAVLIIDAIIKYKRRPKNIIELMQRLYEVRSKQPGYKENLDERMQEATSVSLAITAV